jgi:hypothetical protein
MSPSTLERKHDAWLEHHAHDWVGAGLISESQAAAISEFEHVDEPAGPQRLPIVAEVASYLGSVLAIMGGAVVVGQGWNDMSVFGRAGIGVAIALVGFLAGSWVMRVGEAGASRLGSYLWVLGTAGVAMTVGVVVEDIDSNPRGWLPLLIGVPVLAIGLTLWRNLDRPLQFLTGAAGFGLVLSGAAEITDLDVWHGGLVLLAIGCVFAAGAALGRIEPKLIVLPTGAFSAFIGSFMLGDYNEHLGPAAALATATVLVVYSLRGGVIPLLVLGVIGSLIATQALLATTFTGAVASAIVALLGLGIVAVAVIQTRRTASG